MRGPILLTCYKIELVDDVDPDNIEEDTRYFFQHFDLRDELDMQHCEPLFTCDHTRSEMEFFDFDKSQIIYKFKRDRFFTFIASRLEISLDLQLNCW